MIWLRSVISQVFFLFEVTIYLCVKLIKISLDFSVSFSRLVIHWPVVIDINVLFWVRIQYDMSPPTLWNTPSHLPISLIPIPELSL